MLPTPALLLFIAAMLPLASFALLVCIGRRMGNPLSGYVATAFIAGSWACSVLALVAWFNTGQHAGLTWGPGDKPIAVNFRWLPVGPGVDQEHPGFLDVGIYVDSLTIAMFNMVTLVASVVHLFSIGYMDEDRRYPQYFTRLGLFCFSILGLFLSSTLLQLFFFWQLAGLVSYLLINFWRDRVPAAMAGIKSFIINRMGDVGFLVGFAILFYHTGNASLLQMDKWLGSAGLLDGVHVLAIHLPNGATLSAAAMTVVGIAIFCGTIARCAQFPLHTWLADATEAPALAWALIHSAALVASGVYLIGRIFPILTPDAKLFIAIIGLTTMLMAALIAMVHSDIRRVLAFASISQLGLMLLALGCGSWIGALFHLIMHAFFKSLLFLGCANVLRATGGQSDMRALGGLRRKIPVTAITFAVGVLAASGGPFLSGYFSLDMILHHLGAFTGFAVENHRSRLYGLFYIVPVTVSYLTAFYLSRCWMLTFWGRPRDSSIHEEARESALMWFPLIVLAGVSIVGGSSLLNVKHILGQSQQETRNYCQELTSAGAPAFSGFDQTWPAESEETLSFGAQLVRSQTFWAGVVGIVVGFALYFRGLWAADQLLRIPPVRWVHYWLHSEMFFDEMYFSVFVVVAVGFGRVFAAVDKYLIDGVVNFAAGSVRQAGAVVGWTDRYVVDAPPGTAASIVDKLAPRACGLGAYVTILLVSFLVALAVAIGFVYSYTH